MDILRELSSRFVEPYLVSLGFRLDADQRFRKWSANNDICCVVELRGESNRYSGSIGFCSRQLIRWFGLMNLDQPSLSSCKICGIVFGLGTLLKMKLQMGWQITNENEIETVGQLFNRTLESHLPRLLEQFMAFEGWIRHFRQMVAEQAAGRGIPWSLLGYALLALPTSSFEEIRQVLTAHSQEDGARKKCNRIEKHLEKQRALAFEPFGERV